MALAPAAAIGLVLNTLTGIVFLCPYPENYWPSTAFRADRTVARHHDLGTTRLDLNTTATRVAESTGTALASAQTKRRPRQLRLGSRRMNLLTGGLMRAKSKATSLEVAHLAGVSQSTVSRALRGSATVNEATRRRIQAVADELHYKVDKNASSLRTQQTATLALLFFEDPTLDDSLINPFFLSMLGWITRACANRGYDLLISFQQAAGNWLADCQECKKADGTILLGYGDYVEYLDKLRQLGKDSRFVRWGAVLPEHPGISIGCDNHGGCYEVTRHLLQLGRQRVGFLGHASDHYPEFLQRYRGHSQALSEAGLSVAAELQVDAVSTERSGYDAAHTLLNRGVACDALVCASDLIAIGAMRALQERGRRIPEDVAVSGFDDIPVARFANPSLTTVQQDTRVAGALLVDSLIALIDDQPVASQVIPARVMLRQSTLGEHGDNR